MGGFGSQVREVRPLIADAIVHTMGEQAIPRESLTWHLGIMYPGEEKRYLEALKEAHVLPTTDDDILTWEASLRLAIISNVRKCPTRRRKCEILNNP